MKNKVDKSKTKLNEEANTFSEDYVITHHALKRMHQRSISQKAVTATLKYGYRKWNHGIIIFFFGKRTIRKAPKEIRKFLEPFEGIYVIYEPFKHLIITVYKNKTYKFR